LYKKFFVSYAKHSVEGRRAEMVIEQGFTKYNIAILSIITLAFVMGEMAQFMFGKSLLSKANICETARCLFYC